MKTVVFLQIIALLLPVILSGCTAKQPAMAHLKSETGASLSDVMSGVEANAKVVVILDQYKILVANYLNDNASVSSIPANYKAIGNRHTKWLADYTKHIKAGVPEWEKVRDIESYEEAARHVQKVANTMPPDNALVASTTRFIADVIRTDDILASQQQYLSAMLSSYVRSSFADTIGQQYATMRESIRQTIVDIAAYRRMLRTMKASLTNLQERRVWLKSQVPEAWQRILEYRLVRANSGVARDLIDDINTAIDGEGTAAEITVRADHLLATVRYNYEQFAPYLMRRALHGGLAGLEKMRSRTERERMSDATRKQVRAHLDTVQAQIENYRANSEEMMENRPDYVHERRRIVRGWLARTEVTNSLCKNLAKKISEGSEEGAVLDSDFIKLRKDCM